MRGRRSSVRARTEVCARKDGYSLDDNICYNVGMISVYWASVLFSEDALRLCKCDGVPRMYLYNRLKCYLS